MFFITSLQDRTAWETIIGTLPHEVLHTWGYANACASAEEAPPELVCVQQGSDILCAPLVMRPIPQADETAKVLYDVTSPYGQTGPISSSTDPVVVKGLLAEWIDGLTQRGFVSAFIRMNPYVGVSDGDLANFGHVKRWGRQVFIDLEDLKERGLLSFRYDHRSNIKSMLKAGWMTRTNDTHDIREFPAFYRATMQRLGSADSYMFSDTYFERLFEDVDFLLVAVTSPEGEEGAMALGLFEEGNPVGQYFLSANHRTVSRGVPAKLALYQLALEMERRGVKSLNLGGGRGGEEDSLYDFKSGFGAGRVPLQTAQLILDEGMYDLLSSGHDKKDYFPAYRF